MFSVLTRNYGTIVRSIYNFIIAFHFSNHSIPSENTYNYVPKLQSAQLHDQSKKLDKFKSNNLKQFTQIQQEIKKLKNVVKQKKETLSLESSQAKKIAPVLYRQLSKRVQNLSVKANMQAPLLYLYVGSTTDTYNASAETEIITTTTIYQHSDGSRSEKEDVKKKKKLIIGENLIKLFFWQIENLPLLEALMGHELGHLAYQHEHKKNDSKTNQQHEHEADFFALKLTGQPKIVFKMLDFIEIAGQMYMFMKRKNNLSYFKHEDLHDLIRRIASAFLIDHHDCGALTSAESHTFVSRLINTTLQKTLRKFDYHRYDQCRNRILSAVYRSLEKACFSPNQVLNRKAKYIAHSDARKEQQKNAIAGDITHPAPGIRRQYILDAWSAIQSSTA